VTADHVAGPAYAHAIRADEFVRDRASVLGPQTFLQHLLQHLLVRVSSATTFSPPAAARAAQFADAQAFVALLLRVERGFADPELADLAGRVLWSAWRRATAICCSANRGFFIAILPSP
jgi:hypothetical protein